MRRHILVGTCVLALAACSGSESGGSPDPVPAGGREGQGADLGAPSSNPSGGTTPGASSSDSGTKPTADAGSAGTTKSPLKKLGSLVILGDSIGDGGGVAPFYYDVLKQKLQAKYGTIAYAHEAQSGSKTDALSSQVSRLSHNMPGPVAVCITSGGNDMKAQVQAILLGLDGPARATMGTNVRNALSAILAPNRFGQGVHARVFEANIYDASDGVGDFGAHQCAFGQGLPATPSDGFFGNWNAVVTQEVGAKSQVLMDIHARFRGHGYSGSPNWYARDCTHPNATGHAELAQYFYDEITKQDF
jgi:lysophospholipase L1-like esterase